MPSNRIVFTKESNFEDIASAIRAKTQETVAMKVSEMSAKIRSLNIGINVKDNHFVVASIHKAFSR